MDRKCESSNISEFTDDEIREQLNCLGFKNVPKDKFKQFKSELEKLISQEISINTTANDTLNDFTPIKLKTSQIDGIRDSYLANNKNQLKKVTFPDDSQPLEDHSDSPDQSFASITTTTSSVVNNKLVKRKIVRKINKNTEPEDDLVQSFENLRNPSHFDNEEYGDDYELNQSKDIILNNDVDSQYHSADEQFVKLNDCYAPINYPVKSFIRTHRSQSSLSMRSDMSVRSFKSNPVNKYHEYKKLWTKQKGPGEKSHADLRWSIREQMLEKHVVVKKQPKVYVPNSYLIPTDKKRQNLRWAVRSALANPF